MKITTSSPLGPILQCPQEVIPSPVGVDGDALAAVDGEGAEEDPRSFHSVQASQEAVLFEETQEVVEMAEVAEEGILEVVAEATLEVEEAEGGALEVAVAIKGPGYSRMLAINSFFMSNID